MRETSNKHPENKHTDVSDPLTVTYTLVQSEEHLDELRKLIREALTRRRQVIVHHLARKFSEEFLSHELPSKRVVDAVDDNGWEKIESLSQLRSVVGGRFQNLKRKWTEAGFPLREHRGDRSGKEIELSQDGWLELSVWVSGQGFEIRLAKPEERWFFEVRKV